MNAMRHDVIYATQIFVLHKIGLSALIPYILMVRSGEILIKHVEVSSEPDLIGLHLNVSDWPN